MNESITLGGVSLWHHGVKGMHWGIRRTPEELGHEPKAKAESSVDKSVLETIIVHGKTAYKSDKGFAIQEDKLTGYCLNPKAEHSKEFFDVGYQPTDALKLFRDIENGYDLSKKIEESEVCPGIVKYSIPTLLGVTKTRMFRTVWQTDGPDNIPRFVSAYIDRRLKEE